MHPYCERLRERFYDREQHPYWIYLQRVRKYLGRDGVVLDVGCGRDAPVLRKLVGAFKNKLVGIDIGELDGRQIRTDLVLARNNAK
ncbi:MAG: hypothetical protein ACFFCW_31755, partial [Candidatus Hodarchaeota archaeon]